MLTILKLLPRVKGKQQVEVECYCGKIFIVRLASIKNGNTKSCGCYRRANLTTHNLTKHPLYNTWKQMMRRCYNTGCENYTDYGGRNIEVCVEWHNVSIFIPVIEAILGPRPYRHSLDRINNNGHYEPTNVGWATSERQNRNRRNNNILTIDEKSQCITAWAEEYKLNVSMICKRIAAGRTGIDVLDPPRKTNKKTDV